MLNLISHESNIEKIYLYAKDPYQAKYQLLINKRESTGLKAFIEYSNDMDNNYKNIEEYNPKKYPKILILFDDMIADILSNKKPNPTVTELFIRGRKLNISVFITQSYFTVPKNIRLSSTHYCIMKILNQRELQEIAFNHSSDIIDFQGFMNLYKKCTAKPYYFLAIDATLASDNSSCFRKNLLERI